MHLLSLQLQCDSNIIHVFTDTYKRFIRDLSLLKVLISYKNKKLTQPKLLNNSVAVLLISLGVFNIQNIIAFLLNFMFVNDNKGNELN